LQSNRKLEICLGKLKETTDDDKLIKYCNSICYITSKKIELVNIVLGVRDLLKQGEKKYGKEMYHK